MTGPECEIVELDQTLPLDQAMRVVNGQAQIALGSAALERCANALERLETAVRERRQIYGVTTGFGPHSALGYRPPAPETIIPMDHRPVMH